MSGCIFCKIAAREAKAEVVLETERVIVIRDIQPQAPTHLLIMPKAHYPTLMDCADPAVFSEMAEAAKRAAGELGVAKRGFRLVVNTNQEGGQTVFHLHMHLMAGKPLAGRMG